MSVLTMYQIKKIKQIVLILVTLLGANLYNLNAQETDIGLWINPAIEYKGFKKVDLELSPELRWDQDISRLRSRQLDLKGKYSFKKGYFIGVSVRLGSIQRNSGWQPRQRIQFNGGKKWKPGDFRIGYTTKIQFTFSGKTRTRDADLNSNFRNKLSVSYTGIKKFTPEVSYELFHGLSEGDFLELQDWRFILEGDYKLSKQHSFGMGYLVQQKILRGVDQRDNVLLLKYKYSFG